MGLLQVCDEQAAELRRAEEQLTTLQSALQQRSSAAVAAAARIAQLEAELDAARHEARASSSAHAARDRDATRRMEGLQEEQEHASQQAAAFERLLRERSTQLAEARDKVWTHSMPLRQCAVWCNGAAGAEINN